MRLLLRHHHKIRDRQYFECTVYITPSQHVLLELVYHCNHVAKAGLLKQGTPEE